MVFFKVFNPQAGVVWPVVFFAKVNGTKSAFAPYYDAWLMSLEFIVSAAWA